ncbi:hypothetical protein NG895_27915 [Aeoliella sp. ICT_H6.2]|uniref:Uncharacterized protein n=1 Tax=Aeoliella straminimaris TaxID=2954799 RepID=A0A9X2FG75_9BACT|nr:hypothetical protein [Aeoliella straminimaris]MCO6047748.1 hypothetical protein [Aeoliella straminimaris]
MLHVQHMQATFATSRLAGKIAMVGLALFLSANCSAQNIPRYTPSRPTLSPYLGLLRNNNSAIPNYFAFVRPLERQQQINQQSALTLRKQSLEIERTQEEFNQIEVGATGKGAWFYNFGTRNQFNQRSHFYGQWPQPRTVSRR